MGSCYRQPEGGRLDELHNQRWLAIGSSIVGSLALCLNNASFVAQGCTLLAWSPAQQQWSRERRLPVQKRQTSPAAALQWQLP